MKVSDLAAELEVPASTVLDQCQRFGIAASWAGAELSGADVVVLRSELAGGEPLDLTAADPPADDEPGAESPLVAPAVEPVASGSGPSESGSSDDVSPDGVSSDDVPSDDVPSDDVSSTEAALPPTAVGSMPELIDEVTPDVEDEATSRGPGFPMAGANGTDSVDRETTRSIPPREPPSKRRLDRSARNAMIAIVVAITAFAASNYVDMVGAIVALWLLAAMALAVAVADGIRGRRHVSVHPERVSGLWLSTISLVLAFGGLIGLTLAVVTVISDTPADDAPVGVGELESVQDARWGYQRVGRIADNEWKRPARDEGTCWGVSKRTSRTEERVEIKNTTNNVDCETAHTLEAAIVFAVDRDADSPYPGVDGLLIAAEEVCGPLVEELTGKGAAVRLQAEYPTEQGWEDGDHDVACMLVTPSRDSALAS